MHEGTASAGGTPWVCRHFTLRAAAFLRGCASGARTPRCAWRSSVCAPDDNPREPDRSRSLAPIAHTHGPRDRSAARRPRCAEHAAAGAFGASAHMRRGRNGHRPCPSAVSIGRVHRPCPSAVSIGGLGAAPKRNGARRTPFIACGRNVRPMTRGKPPLARRRAPSVAEAARAEPQSEARGTTTRAASQRGRVAPRPLRSESRRAYFFSGSLPGGVAGLNGNELNMVFAWFCICSCICTNMFFDCSM
ncbi:Uncharacterised protein [Burkholderia pseudomallei]|nr:hypothetical protein DP50_2062 [Burkholderia pseudomallei 576]KGD30590.1 hypothetical protein DP59_5114 [Burkholderia pseudomallei]CAJ5642414.1 Uncharacterised protein [Burkholderia pseudomallei]VBC10940.1 Uncharacterised protein [Burkholderia pseudomallei]VBI27691.1 Uncharacterised protein [Burkholderia pseudomallei]